MNKHIALLLTLFIISKVNSQSIHYDISFPNIQHHEATIALTASGIPAGKATVRMSRSSPGRYATHEFGKNVYDVKAFDKQNKPVAISRIDGDIYEVPQQSGFVKVEYTLYANYPDGTYSGIDITSIHLNMPSAFMWIKGYDKAPITVTFNLPADNKWTIATQLKPAAKPNQFSAPGLQYFMDCPTKIGNLVWKEWSIKNPDGKNYNFKLALEAETSDSLATAFAAKVQRITQEAQAVYGETPAYDYGAYTFIASINPWVKGDGMEHRNSTMISLPFGFNGSNGLLEVFAHEFFHCWNVERIRPKTLEPFNFEKSNMSSELWCAEGFTQYYGDLLMTRAGFQSVEEYLPALAGLINTKENTAGAKHFSPAEMSRHAVFVDAGVAIDRTNYPNMFSSYYPYGGAIALALDLELRTKFNHTLDDYMKALWLRFGKPEIPYTIPALQEVLVQLTNKNFASEFFSKYITGHQSFDYKPLLEKAGLLLKKGNAGKAWIGMNAFRDGSAVINNNTIIGSPLYEAGVDIEDQITQLDNKPVQKASDIVTILAEHKPGDVIDLQYKHRNKTINAKITLSENPAYSLSTYEQEGMTVTPEMLQFRNSWLGTKLTLSSYK
jgi:predicted metalloprotease with PDZ domain